MKTILILLMSLVSLHANVLTFHGEINSTTPNPLIKVGDDVFIKINYSPSNNNVNRVTVTVNDSMLNLVRANDRTFVVVDADPSDGTVQWGISGSSVNVDVATNTPGGVIPCIDDFDLGRTLQIFFNGINATGTVVATPNIRTGN